MMFDFNIDFFLYFIYIVLFLSFFLDKEFSKDVLILK